MQATFRKALLLVLIAAGLTASGVLVGSLGGLFGCGGSTGTTEEGPAPVDPSGGGDGSTPTPDFPPTLPVKALSMGLDPSFGTNGMFKLDAGKDTAQFAAIAVQADGKLVASGYYGDVNTAHWPYSTNAKLAVMRLDAQGQLDPGFGTGGIVQLDCASTWGLTLWAKQGLAIQSDGKIAAAGECATKATIFRLNIDGSPDVGFDGDGKAELPAEAGGLWATGFVLTLQPTALGEKILIGGQSNTNNPHYWTNRWLLARLNADGSLDASFAGGAGILYQQWSYADEGVFAIAVLADGKLMVYGGYMKDAAASADFAVARFSADGVLDTTFGAGDSDGIDGLTVIDFGFNDWGFDASVQRGVAD